jgi:flagellar biosynthesis/type III secretory pathway protein FliH
MSWSETIVFAEPLRELRRLAEAPAANWQELLRTREENAYQRGRREAENELKAHLSRREAEMEQTQRRLLESLSRAVPQVIQQTESALIELALEAAKRVVAGLPISPQLVESVVREALREAEGSSEVTVQLHPDDLELLRAADSKLLKGFPETVQLRFIASSEVTRGGCIVQTRLGLIDARREVKLEQLAKTVAG